MESNTTHFDGVETSLALPTTFIAAEESAVLTKMLELELEQASQVAGGLCPRSAAAPATAAAATADPTPAGRKSDLSPAHFFGSIAMISNEQLRTAFLAPAMKHYFERKLADLPPAEVAARIEELLKFLNMTTHSHGPIPVSEEIDDAWHLWVLQTRQYSELCRKLQGGNSFTTRPTSTRNTPTRT